MAGYELQGQLLIPGILWGTCLLSICIVAIPKFRYTLIHRNRAHLYEHAPFLFLSLISFIIGFTALVEIIYNLLIVDVSR